MAGIRDRLIFLHLQMRAAHGAAFMLVEERMLGAEQR
jgi:hypothetical protein